MSQTPRWIEALQEQRNKPVMHEEFGEISRLEYNLIATYYQEKLYCGFLGVSRFAFILRSDGMQECGGYRDILRKFAKMMKDPQIICTDIKLLSASWHFVKIIWMTTSKFSQIPRYILGNIYYRPEMKKYQNQTLQKHPNTRHLLYHRQNIKINIIHYFERVNEYREHRSPYYGIYQHWRRDIYIGICIRII